MKRVIALVVFIACIFGWMNSPSIGGSIAGQINPQPQYTVDNAPLEGQPNYPVPVSKRIDYWVVNCPVSGSTTQEVDHVLENLNADHIAQTVILCMPTTVPEPTSYVMRFLRYMELGLPDGERKNNGLVILVLQDGDKLDVHYGVGFGLPALTAQGLSPINRLGEEAYAESKNMDQAILAIAHGLDAYARSEYDPLDPVAPSYGSAPEKSSDVDPATIWSAIGLFAALVLVTETVLSLITLLFGSETTFRWMAWPWHAIMFFAQVGLSFTGSSTNSSQSSQSSGRSGSGGGATGRGN